MNDDIEKIWAQIDADFEADDQQEVSAYIKKKGWKYAPKDNVSDLAESLLQQAFIGQDSLKISPSKKYKIIKQLDFGGQSDIYLAERSDGIYKKTVIIKYTSQIHQNPRAKQQFLQEMQMLADLNHPGVVAILDGGLTEKGQPWLVLDYLDGQHIDQYCLNEKLTENNTVKLVIELCDALRFVHLRGVLHLDIKPNNVIIQSINNVPHPVLIDFGIAQKQNANQSQCYGTPGYAAPELFNSNGQPNPSTDVYALGMLLAQLLCKNQVNNIGVVSKTERHQLLQKNQVHPDLLSIIDQATQKGQNYRYLNTEALRNDLNNHLHGMPLSMNSGFSHNFIKGIKRHKWLSASLSIGLILSLVFGVKYTKDIQQLQQITLREKQQSDELMNFMLDDLFDELNKIGRVDVLKTVTEKSVNHLADQDPRAMTDLDHIQSAKAYMNAGKIFDTLELSQQGKQAYMKAKDNLKPLESLPHTQSKRDNLLGKINIGLSQVLSSEGQEEATEKVLTETIKITEGLKKLGMLDNNLTLWEAYLQLGWHYLEYGKDSLAIININSALKLSQEMLQQNTDDEWQFAQSQGLQLKAWYEIDFGSLTAGTDDLISAIDYAKQAITIEPNDIKKQHNLRILLNQLGYFFLENQKNEQALPYVDQAVNLGIKLKAKAPYNLEYQRELAVSYSTAGEVLQQLGKNAEALAQYQNSLIITEFLAAQDKNNYSIVNDLAIDSLLVANLNDQLGYSKEAQKLWLRAAELMQPIQLKEPNNKYYSHTLLVALIQLKRYSEAEPLYQMIAANGMEDQQIKTLIIKHDLLNWLDKKKGSD